MSDFHLIVAVPARDYWAKPFGMSLCSLVAYLCTHEVPGYKSWDFSVRCTDDSILPRARQHLIEVALEVQATHVLFIDSDQSFPPDTLHRLAAWGKPVVACNIAVKRLPSSPTARARAIHEKTGSPQFVVPGESGLVKTWRIGTGVMLVNLSVFSGMPKPWFDTTWNQDYQQFEGEDWYFCQKLQEKGIDVFYDNELSQEIGHWGPFEFRHEHVPVPRGYRWEGETYGFEDRRPYNLNEGGKGAKTEVESEEVWRKTAETNVR